VSNVYTVRAHKKSRLEIGGPKITQQPNDSSAQSDITRNCQNQDSPLVKNKWKPGFVIKLFHRVSQKTVRSNNLLSYDVTMITERGNKSKKNRHFQNVNT
jgi:hypothetical protein